ncbi:MAG: hypothetical protein R3C99_21685 [Pirellulaceae bacterium]|nr:hypothetical protein [Planctomycetales bacterium]MCA9163238.1 hypothetical protein [Planctomycetales bacterium]MCA9203201.1 hypothetical protein [Planctomycetales bacterium]MCA9209810.1 hypothetical protein [Planctomycetales bacterium]MCA9220564.1 hypothetical protein [Planctomycetales bacterium]
MAKFYVQSGTLREMVQADDARKAALWAVHRSMQQILPIYDDHAMPASEKHQVAQLQGLFVLGDEIRLSELGFDRDDALEFETFDIVTEWNQLMIALARLEESLMAVR